MQSRISSDEAARWFTVDPKNFEFEEIRRFQIWKGLCLSCEEIRSITLRHTEILRHDESAQLTGILSQLDLVEVHPGQLEYLKRKKSQAFVMLCSFLAPMVVFLNLSSLLKVMFENALEVGQNAIGTNTDDCAFILTKVQLLRSWRAPIMQGYGLTETCAGATFSEWDDSTVGRVGPPLPSCYVKVVLAAEVPWCISFALAAPITPWPTLFLLMWAPTVPRLPHCVLLVASLLTCGTQVAISLAGGASRNTTTLLPTPSATLTPPVQYPLTTATNPAHHEFGV
eukprot:Gb_21771 [translate_table: standard]